MLRLGVLLLLQVQLVLGNRTVAPSSLFKGTSLEQLITRAFNARVADGTWASIYGSYDDLIEQPYCSGFVDDWLLPEVTGDLQRVLEKGVFTCGYSQNVNYEVAGSPENGILIRAGETPDTLTGMHVDWWESLIEYAGEAIDTPMQLEWKLYPSSQDAFTALYEGEIDAMCAQWAGDGTWMVPGLEESYVRGVYFDVFTCPPFLQRKFVYTNVSLGTFPTIESLADPIIDGRITDVCVTGTPGGGFEQSCENTIQLYTNETVRCTGYGADAFAEFLDGKCQAVWDGVPPPATFSRYNAIELPYLYVPVYYFRQKDLPKSDPPKSSKTTLELAVTLAYERVIEKGVWDKLIGSVAGIETAGFCFGDSRNWPQPAVVDGTDLAAVVNRGTFIW